MILNHNLAFCVNQGLGPVWRRENKFSLPHSHITRVCFVLFVDTYDVSTGEQANPSVKTGSERNKSQLNTVSCHVNNCLLHVDRPTRTECSGKHQNASAFQNLADKISDKEICLRIE